MDDEIVHRIATSVGLSTTMARRVIYDVLDYYHEPLNDWVRRRHRECKREGLRNPEIYARIAAEAADRVVAAPPLSERQIRRIITG